jgi:O-antigen/teichoic acid export membrane protein
VKPQPFTHRFAALIAGELVNKASVAIAFIWLARVVGHWTYGEIEWAVSIAMLCTLAADAGLSTWAAAQLAAQPERAAALVAGVARLRFALAVPAYAVIVLMARLQGGSSAGPALLVYGLGLFFTPLFLQYLFNGLHQTRWAALGNAARGVTFAAIIVLFARADSTPMLAAVAELLGIGVMVAIHAIVLRRVFALPVRLNDATYPVLSLLGRSWTVCASELTWGLHWYAGLILLGMFASAADAAWQSASLRLILGLHTGVWLYLYALLPGLARLWATDAAEWRRLIARSLRMTGWAGGAIALVGTLAAPTIIETIFGARFAPSADVLRAMIWIIPIAWMSGHIRYALIGAGQPQKDFQAAIAGAITTIGLTLLLMPRFRSFGAGLAITGGTAANAIAAWALARRTLPPFPLREALAGSAASCAGAIALGAFLTPIVGEVPATAVALVLFGAVAVIAERETIRDLVQSHGALSLMKASSNADARP